MSAALDRLAKHMPSLAAGGVLTVVTVFAWGRLNPVVPVVNGVNPTGDAHGLAEPVPDCSSVYPSLKVCSQLPHRYMFGSEQEALSYLKSQLGTSNLRIQTPTTATGGPCPGTGQHYNVRDSKNPRDYPASIVCCPCCDDDHFGDPIQDRLCGIVAKNPGCEPGRRAIDASCTE